MIGEPMKNWAKVFVGLGVTAVVLATILEFIGWLTEQKHRLERQKPIAVGEAIMPESITIWTPKAGDMVRLSPFNTWDQMTCHSLGKAVVGEVRTDRLTATIDTEADHLTVTSNWTEHLEVGQRGELLFCEED